MATEPFPTNTSATVVNTAIDGIFQVGVNLAEAALIAEVPWLGLPVIKTLVDFIVKGIANKIYQQFAMFTTFEIINFQKSGELSDDKKALVSLISAQKLGDQNAIQKALNDFAKARASLTHLDGSASPGSL